MCSQQRPASALSVGSKDIDKQLDDLMVTEKDDQADSEENVAVMVRCRPLSTSEQKQSKAAAVQVDEATKSVQVDKDRRFFFDQVFDIAANNEQVYMRSARRLVEFAFGGYNCTIFLYGQTGTGKTYTHSSITLSAFEHLFGLIQSSNKQARFLIRASYYELYNEEIRDLLAAKQSAAKRPGKQGAELNKPLELHESKARGVYIKDLTCFLVNNLAELVRLKQVGDKRRATAATKMNEHSSRSHSIFSITIETTSASADEQTPKGAKRAAGAKSNKSASLRLGRLHLIDLAGSERQSKSGSSGLQLKEASRINLSLTCLSLVIRALTDKTSASHVPYRNSKLTRLLSSSLGGNSKTLLMACISPAQSSLDETMNTLRFAARTKKIKNKAVVNEDPKDALLRKYRRQLNELRERLNQSQQADPSERTEDSQLSGEELQRREEHQQQQAQLMRQLELLKAKIMFGGENLLDKAELHERLLEASRQELAERQRAEAKLRDELKSKEQALKSVVHSKGSLENQRSYLDEKLAKAMSLYRRSKLELRDLSSEHERLKEQLLVTVKSTSKEIKYTDCILDDFIPHEYLDLINAYSQYDEESEEWQVKYIAQSGNNIAQTKKLAMSSATTSDDNDREPDGPGEGRRTKKQRSRTHQVQNRPDPFLRFVRDT